MGSFFAFFRNEIVRRFLRYLSFGGICLGGYFIFFTRNYNLYWSYYLFGFSLIIFFNTHPKKKKLDAEPTPFREKFKIGSIILMILNTLLFLYQYNQNLSPHTLDQSQYDFFTSKAEYSITEENPPSRFENMEQSLARIRKTKYHEMQEDFAELFLNDLSNFQGKSLNIFDYLNEERIRLREGEPVELYFPIRSVEDIRIGPLKVRIYPNKYISTHLMIPKARFRVYEVEYSEETKEHFFDIYNRVRSE